MELMMEKNKSIRQWFDHITTFLSLETKPFNFNGKEHGCYNMKKNVHMSSYGFWRQDFCCFLSKLIGPVLDDGPNRNNPHFHIFALSCTFFSSNCSPDFISIFWVSYCEVVSVPDTVLCSTGVWCLKELKKPWSFDTWKWSSNYCSFVKTFKWQDKERCYTWIYKHRDIIKPKSNFRLCTCQSLRMKSVHHMLQFSHCQKISKS